MALGAKSYPIGSPLPTPLSKDGIPPSSIAPVAKGKIFAPGALPAFTPTGFSASDELRKRREAGEPLAASYKTKRLGEVAPLEDKLSKMKQAELDDKFRMENLARKFDASRSGAYGGSSMADAMSRAYKDQSRQRASSRAETAKFGHGLTRGVYDRAGSLSTMAARGELGGSADLGGFDVADTGRSIFGALASPTGKGPLVGGIFPYRPSSSVSTKAATPVAVKKKKAVVEEEESGGDTDAGDVY